MVTSTIFLARYKLRFLKLPINVAELSHNIYSPTSFKVEYKRTSASSVMFQRQVRFQVDISEISRQSSELLFAITFTLLNGSIRRFRRICEHIQSQVCSKTSIPRLETPFSETSESSQILRKHSLEFSESSSYDSNASGISLTTSNASTKEIGSSPEQELRASETHIQCKQLESSCLSEIVNSYKLNSSTSNACREVVNSKHTKNQSDGV
ncbi:serine/threonine kinase SAD-1-like [Copidosoma floridanum]|uniref:serine/threonine kinase SAD-1-like n=1 Tax=Copidosoma floridanum TaxID=29053 RepID=UPI0006C94646|nr:serine/threonine kinase SAD-1-like [Copidosoma floridanum]